MSGRIVVECAAPGHPKGRTAKLETFTRTDHGWSIDRPGEPRSMSKTPAVRTLMLDGNDPLPGLSIEYDSLHAWAAHRPIPQQTLDRLAAATAAGTVRYVVEFRCPLCPAAVGPVQVRREKLWALLDAEDTDGVSRLDLSEVRRTLSGSK